MQGIHITGASGSGVTTLGGALAARLGAAHLDTDSFDWLPTDPPFHQRRPVADRLEMMERAFAAADYGWVLSGSLDGWGDAFIPRFSIVVFVYTPHDVRMARIHGREEARWRSRDPARRADARAASRIRRLGGKLRDRSDRPGHATWRVMEPG